MGSFLTYFICIYFLLLPYQISCEEEPFHKIFLQVPNATSARQHLFYYTSMPHIAGSFEDYQTAVYTRDQMLSYGIPQAEIVPMLVTLSYPISRSVQIVYPESSRFNASMQEPAIPEDPTSSNPNSVPTYNGYSPSGDVTAEIVYVNYGRIEDYQVLEENGINVTDRIVIARYGKIFRGTKAMIAQSKSAKGILIYSDPLDDGFSRGNTFPNGPWRPADAAQRGSTQFLSMCPGDPQRSECNDTLPKIPIQPLSWRDAEPILKGLQGLVVPGTWQGGLNFTYHFGPGPIVVHLINKMNFTQTPIWNVIARINGTVEPDRQVILGNHRDAWVFGAVDPSSGSSALLEVARGYGTILKQGWKPRRTIILASWDAEEFGLVGSTWYGEHWRATLKEQAVAYLNVDIGPSGRDFGGECTPSLSSLVKEISTSIIDPNTSLPIWEVWKTKEMGSLGSGSDYTVFADHLGIASSNIYFDGDYGVYHSIYDSFTWMSLYGDPTFEYHRALAQFWGLMGLRLADDALLPMDYLQYAKDLGKYLEQLKSLISSKNAPVSVDELSSAIDIFAEKSKLLADYIKTGDLYKYNQLRQINDILIYAERKFIEDSGLPNRPWYKHVLQAPGLYQGYASDVFPGPAQAIRDGDWDTAKAQITVLARKIHEVASFLGTGVPDWSKPQERILVALVVVMGFIGCVLFGIAIYYFRKLRNSFYYSKLNEANAEDK